ncbi:MAG: hypothetical protein K2O78_08730 [Muribaculaceae bacterium]|nr:hypothetical protein [Muribaculaceae bacterium]
MAAITATAVTSAAYGSANKASFTSRDIRIENVMAWRADSLIRLTADIRLDSLQLASSRQLLITPVITDGAGNSEVLPPLMVNGRSMQIAWERRSLSGENRDVAQAVRRRNGKPQCVEYMASLPLEKWMWNPAASISWTIDSCGCGQKYGSAVGNEIPLGLNRADEMRVAYVTPPVTALPVSVHQGETLVGFEVNRTDLHSSPYRCADGKIIDNRPQLQVIADSISYALTDGNVEIAGINICGFASPEGDYNANSLLATGRSRALAEYIADRYLLPDSICTYESVAENWEGLRAIVESRQNLTPSLRRRLLDLIDTPAYGAADYDARERMLRSDPQLKDFYRDVMLKEWFPSLRTSRFTITTRLRPLSDIQLAEVIRSYPERMTLNQMYRVARLYPEDSDEFQEVMNIAFSHYPDDPVANLNLAIALISAGDYEKAALRLERSGDSAEAMNARGILALYRGDADAAEEYFRKALPLPEASRNLQMLR